MGWLHAWAGFLIGLPLFCIFLSGTLSVFDRQITRWLQPELPATAGPLSPVALDQTRPRLRALMQAGERPFLTLPSATDPFLRVEYHDGHEFLSFPYDPVTGHELPVRSTAGGTFFYDLHYSFRCGTAGITVMTLCGLVLTLLLGTALVMHFRNLVSDLVLLRLRAAQQRFLTDLHVVASVPFLPFLFMMSLTGAFVHLRTVMPPFPIIPAVISSFHPEPPEKKTTPLDIRPIRTLSDLLPVAKKTLGPAQTGFVLFSTDRIMFVRTDASGPFLTREHVDFSPEDGHFIGHTLLTTPLTRTQQLLQGIHYARWAGQGMRWLYFLSGLAGTAVTGSGLILFLNRRRKKESARFAFRLAEALTVSVIPGLLLAVEGFFWSSRLLPLTLPARPQAEVNCFFLTWALAALAGTILCLTGRSRAAWRTGFQLFAASALLLGTGDLLLHLRSGLSAAQTGTDAVSILSGLITLTALRFFRV